MNVDIGPNVWTPDREKLMAGIEAEMTNRKPSLIPDRFFKLPPDKAKLVIGQKANVPYLGDYIPAGFELDHTVMFYSTDPTNVLSGLGLSPQTPDDLPKNAIDWTDSKLVLAEFNPGDFVGLTCVDRQTYPGFITIELGWYNAL